MIEVKQSLLAALGAAIHKVSPETSVPAIFESPKQRDDLSLLVDGQLVAVLSDNARVHLRSADFSLTLVSMTNQDFYDVLHQKMGWTGTAIGGEG